MFTLNLNSESTTKRQMQCRCIDMTANRCNLIEGFGFPSLQSSNGKFILHWEGCMYILIKYYLFIFYWSLKLEEL